MFRLSRITADSGLSEKSVGDIAGAIGSSTGIEGPDRLLPEIMSSNRARTFSTLPQYWESCCVSSIASTVANCSHFVDHKILLSFG